MAKSVLGAKYGSNGPNTAKMKRSRSQDAIGAAYGATKGTAKENRRRRSRSNGRQRQNKKGDNGDEEIDMEALAEYVNELKKSMAGPGGSSVSNRRTGGASRTSSVARHSSKQLSVHEMSKVKKKVYSALNQADIAIAQQRAKKNIPFGVPTTGKKASNRSRSRVSAGSLRPRLHRQHQNSRNKKNQKGGWKDALKELTAERIAWFETVTYVAPGKSGKLRRCPANRNIVQDALDGDPYAGFRGQILSLPKPSRMATAKKIIENKRPTQRKRDGRLGFGGSSTP